MSENNHRAAESRSLRGRFWSGSTGAALFVVALALLISTAIFALSRIPGPPAEGADYDVTQVADDVYTFRWKVHRNLFVVTEEGVIVTDPINTLAANQLAREIRKITELPVRYVVYSHEHWDHVLGGRVFKEMGAIFISHNGCLASFERSPHPDLVLPDVTFSGSAYNLKLGGKILELRHFGPSHGEGMIVMRLPEERILHIVDLVTPKAVGFRILPDYSPIELIRTLKEIEEGLDFDRIVPGHLAAVADASAISVEREYFEDLMAAVKHAMERGVDDPAQLVKQVKLAKYDKWTGYQEWLPLNVERAWAYYHMGW